MTIREFDKPRRAVNYSVLRKVKHQKSYDIPLILSTNVRELTNKVDDYSTNRGAQLYKHYLHY